MWLRTSIGSIGWVVLLPGCDYGKTDLRQCQDLRTAGKLTEAIVACERSEKRGGDSGAEAARLLPTLGAESAERIAAGHLDNCMKLRVENAAKALAACEQAAGVTGAGMSAEKAKAAIPLLKEAALEAEKEHWWKIGSRLSEIIQATGFADLKYGRLTKASDVIKAEAGEPSGVYNSGWGTETFVWGRKFGDKASMDEVKQAPFSVKVIANVACGDFTSPMASIYSYGQEIRPGSARPTVVAETEKAPPPVADEAEPSRSPVPGPLESEWASARECTVSGSSALNCETKVLDGYFRAVCRSNGLGEPNAVSFVSHESPMSVAKLDGGNMVLVHPYREGVRFSAKFSWGNISQVLSISWKEGSARPFTTGSFSPAP